jgi:sugar phosphate isomerase/epimerase
MSIPFAVQLWSVRDEIKSAGMANVLSRVGKMGYAGVEFAGYYNHSAAEIAKFLGDAGLKCAGTHIGLDALEGDKLKGAIEFHKAIGCEYLIVPGIGAELRNTPEVCKKTAERFTKASELLRPHGLKTGFHLHDADAKPLSDGVSAWYHFARSTPKDFILQFDTGNAMMGGEDPVRPLLDFPGRGLSTHLKEFPHDGTTPGLGIVPWASVLDATQRVAGTKWHVIEIEVYSKFTPMEAIAASLAAMTVRTR